MINIAKRRNYEKEYYARNKERILSRMRDRYRANPEKKNAMNKKWHIAHPEQRLEHSRQYRKRNHEKCLESNRKSWAKHAVKYRAQKSAYRKANRHIGRHSFNKYRALKEKASVNLAGIKEFMSKTYAKKYAVCYYCQNRVSTKNIHFDHIIALSKGGSHSVDNLCVACVSCNCRKWAKPVQDWITVGQQLLPL